MADVKISALPASTTPLAGTEVLPIVQSSTTKQVSVANLTAGRAITASNLTVGTQQSSQGSVVLANTAAGAYSTTVQASNSSTAAWTLTLPPAAPAANGAILTSTTAGVGSWASTIPVANGGTGLSSGTSGGVPYFSAADTITSSAALTNGALVVGGGAGAAPYTPTTLFWDNVNGSLGVGTTTPGTNKFIAYTASGYSTIRARSAGTTASDIGQIIAVGGSTNTQFLSYGNGAGYLLSNGSLGLYVATSVASQLEFQTNNTARASIDADGNHFLGVGALATNATTGFPYIPTCAGAPTGVPTAKTGMVPIVYDSTNNKLYVYNGAWKATAALT